MGGDVAAGAGAGVLGDEAAQLVPEAAGAGDEAADAVELAQFAGGDADQRDQVVGLPEAVDVALAEPDRAAVGAAPGGRVVDADGRPEVGAGLAEAAAAAPLDHLDLAGADAAEHLGQAGAGERVFHGSASAGWGK